MHPQDHAETSSSVTGQLLIHEGFWIPKCSFLKSGHLGTGFFKATIQVLSRRSFCRSIKWSHEFIKSQKWFLENWEINGGFLKWWYPTTIGFPTTHDHFGVFWWYHHLSKHPICQRDPSISFVLLIPSDIDVNIAWNMVAQSTGIPEIYIYIDMLHILQLYLQNILHMHSIWCTFNPV